MTTEYRIKKAHRETQLNRQRRIAAGILICAALFVWFISGGSFGATQTEAAEDSSFYITVSPGDSLWSIASKYRDQGTDIRDYARYIADYNGIDDNMIYAGQNLCIPY